MTIDFNSVPLSALTHESRKLLCSRLNTKKVLPIVGPDNVARHRDWRGLASLIDISIEEASSLIDCQNKTESILTKWQGCNSDTATVGHLLVYLQILDRYDVYDDLLLLAKDEKLNIVSNISINNNIQELITLDGSDEDIITYDDKLFGKPQRYHAYVLYAMEDKDFVDELLLRMRREGFKICTEEDLVAGHATKFEPVARLMADRCRYIILVYSPDFLRSSAINFCMNLAQADSISKRQSKMVPVMFRQCVLPRHIAHYHSLRYCTGAHASYDFWERLSYSLRIVDKPRYNSTSSILPTLDLSEMTPLSSRSANGFKDFYLNLPDVPSHNLETSSMGDPQNHSTTSTDYISTYETKSLSNISQASEGKKKKNGPIRKIINTFRGKKRKKAVVLEN